MSFQCFLFWSLNQVWKFSGERAKFLWRTQRWKVEAKDKRLILFFFFPFFSSTTRFFFLVWSELLCHWAMSQMGSFYDKWGCHSNNIPPLSSSEVGAGDTLEKQKSNSHLALFLSGPQRSCSDILSTFFCALLFPNTFQSGEEKGWGWSLWGGGGRHFQLMIISACVCLSHKLWVCSLATFSGKVCFPPLRSSPLPDPDGARRRSVCMRAEIRRCWFQRAATGRGRVHIVSEVKVKAGCAFKCPSVLSGMVLLFHLLVLEGFFGFWAWRLPAPPWQQR